MGVAARAPLLGLIAIFAREREARIESVLTLRDAYRGTAHLLGEVLATTHEYTGSHSRSVVVIARQVGVSLGVSELVLREIEFGALLHDVGKMAVPNEILNKPAALTDAEMRTVRRHTLEGERMLERIGGMLGEIGVGEDRYRILR
jgi:HD-GYP domain-containing protein (c-di-GMP phosphodiesterase class II)